MTLVPTHSNGRIKIRFSGHSQESTSGQTWSKLTKISDNLEFDVKTWKVFFLGGFNQFWPLVSPRQTEGILVILM